MAVGRTLEGERRVELPRRLRLPEHVLGEPADALRCGGQRRRRQRLDLDFGRPALLERWPIGFEDLRLHLHLGQVDDLGDGASGLHGVSLPVLRQAHAGEVPAAGRILVVLDDDEAVERRAHGHALDVLPREVGRDSCLAPLLLQHRPGRRGCSPRASSRRPESATSARLVSSSLMLFFSASMRPTNSLPLTSISARRTSCCACSSARRSVEHLDLAVGPQLRDLLLGLGQLRLRLLQVVLLLGAIELDDDVVFLHEGAGGRERDDLQQAAHRGRGERHRPARRQLAERVHA